MRLLLCAAVTAATLGAPLDAVADRPNIVIILADDLGYGDLGCYNEHSKVPTPHLDHLAAQGMRFTDAHSPSSVCTPTRYGLLTGRYCWRTALKRSVLWSWDPPLIEPNRLTLPGMLQMHGYRTACIGKWHLGWDWPLQGGGFITDEFDKHTIPEASREAFGRRIDFRRATRGGPTARGFDIYFGVDVPNFPPYCFLDGARTVGLPTVAKPPTMFGHPGPALPAWDLSLVPPTLTQRAVQFIEQQAGFPDTPFFLYLPLTAPHVPIAPSPHFVGQSEAGWYGDFVNQLDWTVGQVLAALDRTSAAQDTLVIFTSDNGSPQRDGTNMSGEPGSVKSFGHDPSRPWRGMKGDVWEGGHRVPFIARWPQRVPAAQTCGEPVVLTDLMRTIANCIGHAVPPEAAEDSFDIGPKLFGEATDQPIRDHLIHHSSRGVFAIRRGPWKLIMGKGSGGFTRYQPPPDASPGQLYNLSDDPAERNNVYREHPTLVKELTDLLESCQQQGWTYTTRS